MTEKKEIEVEGKSIQEAIEIALKKLDAKRDEVEIKILKEETKGLFGMKGAEPAKIKVIIKEKNNSESHDRHVIQRHNKKKKLC